MQVGRPIWEFFLPVLVSLPVSIAISWLVERVFATGTFWQRVAAMNIVPVELAVYRLLSKNPSYRLPALGWLLAAVVTVAIILLFP